MNADTVNKSTGPVRRCKFPWKDWLVGATFEKPTVLTFGKEIPKDKSPQVLTTQIHQWAKIYKLWAYTSVNTAKTTISIYTVKRGKNKRPDTLFPYPSKGPRMKKTTTVCDSEKTIKAAKKTAKKASTKSAPAKKTVRQARVERGIAATAKKSAKKPAKKSAKKAA